MSELRDFLTTGGNLPYRGLIQHHLRRQSLEETKAGVFGTIALLPESYRPAVQEYIDRANKLYGLDQQFWKSATVEYAFDVLMGGIVPFVFPVAEPASFHKRVLGGQEQELAFNLFQIITLNFAYSAHLTPAHRKLMGIKKGWFS
jgi:hypothetical protein